ncbi:MAG: hypothetical protein MJZ71_06080 [Bacteroidales bacterium]|nr:hypothetical protein [Bacteroidales bacterium]
MYLLDTSNIEEISEYIIPWIFVVLFLYLFFIRIPSRMATARGRRPWVWILLSFIISPIWVYIILAIIGESKEKMKQDIINEIRNRNLD